MSNAATSKTARAIYSAFRAAMRGDWAQTRPETYPEWCKAAHHGRPGNGADWMALGTKARAALAGRPGLF